MVLERDVSEPTVRASSARGRWKRRIVLFLVFLFVAGAVSGAGWLATYQPLRYGNQFGAPGVAKVVDTAALGSEYRYAFERSGEFEIFVDIENGGPVAVTVDRVEPHTAYYYRLREVRLGVGRYVSRGSAPTGFVAWRPVSLAPGEHAFLALGYEFADCDTQEGASSWFSSIRVRYSVGWFEDTATVDLPSPVVVTGASGDCGRAGFVER